MSAEPKPDLQLEIAHLLLIDVVGYSTLLVNEQIDVVQELNRVVRSTSSFQAAQKENKLLRVPTGDGMALIFFRSPEEPTRCAIEIGEALKQHPEVHVRMGIHSGPVNQVTDVSDHVNVAGTGINVAQRIMDCGDAGHILMSQHTAEDLAQYGHWRPFLHDLGEYEVKHGLRVHIVNLHKDGVGNPMFPEKLRRWASWKRKKTPVAKPVRQPKWSRTLVALALCCSAIALAVSFVILFRHGPATSSQGNAEPDLDKSIAVLPFENRSEEKANGYIADGIQDEILTRLAKIGQLKVISRTSTQHYHSTPENLPEIARQLGVAHILEGSVQKIGDSVRVNVQLIKAATDSHIWADTFDRKLTDILTVESEVAKAIADKLRAKLTGREEEVIAAKPTQNPEAYDAYLRGLSAMNKAVHRTASATDAQRCFREAVRLDPNFALSWARLSYVDARGYLTQALQPTTALREEARQAADTALRLEPNLGEASVAKGQYHYGCLKDYDTAVQYFEQARQLLPNSSQIPESLAYVSRRKGQWDQAERYFKEAERLDPRNPSLITQHAQLDIVRRRFPEALRKFDQVLQIVPNDVDTIVLKAAAAQAEGDLPRAAAWLSPLRLVSNNAALETQAYQAILERRPENVIARLKETVAAPDPALGFYNAELRFWLGWAQQVAGDRAAAEQTWRLARTELESFLKDQPNNYTLIGDLALTSMGLGDKSAALKLAERAIAANPIEKDAVTGPAPVEIMARVAAGTGEPDRAIAALQQLLAIPYASSLATQDLPLTPALLRLDPMFDPLRNDRRFQQLTGSSVLK